VLKRVVYLLKFSENDGAESPLGKYFQFSQGRAAEWYMRLQNRITSFITKSTEQ
jgi:hypothetical protein